jgi:hypothetical protein
VTDLSVGEASDALPDDALVLRGGHMQPDTLETNALTEYDASGRYALSVFSAPGLDREQLARVAAQPRGQVRLSTVGRIRTAGYEIVRSENIAPAHADLILPNPPTDADYEAVIAAFDPPVPNPARR